MKDIHIPTIEELLSSEPEFNIEELSDGYRISGIQYRGQTRTYDFSKKVLPDKRQERHVEHALHAADTEFITSNAPLVYAICKTLYQNKDGPKKDLVEKARKTLEGIIGPSKPWINTLSRAIYDTTGQGEIIHDYKQKTRYPKPAKLAGPDGHITKPETQAEDYTHALLDTTDSMQEINEVFNWITGQKTYTFRQNSNPKNKQEWVVALGVVGDRFILDAGSGIEVSRPALGVRLVK